MIKTCPECGKLFSTDYPTKIYCNKKCADKAAAKRDESYYDFPHDPDAEPLFSFECSNCGKTVHVYSKYDQRSRFCCGKCAYAFKSGVEAMRLAKQRYTSNLGMSGGMSFGSLIKREARSADKNDGVEVRICKTCGKHFEVSKRSPDRKYCSIECEFKATQKKNVSSLGIRVCEVCGKEFPAVHVSQKYCSPKCRAHRNYVQQRDSGVVRNFKIAHGRFGVRVRLIKTCPVCGQEFVAEGSKSHQKYCSADCRNEAARRRASGEKEI